MELSDLFEITEKLSNTLNYSSIIDHLLLSPMGRMMINGGIFLLHIDGNRYRIESVKGLDKNLLGKIVKIDDPPEKYIIIDNTGREDWKSLFYRTGVHLVFPVYSREKIIGIAGYGRKVNGDQFYPSEIHFLSSLLNIGAASIQNSFIVNELNSLNKRLDKKNQELNTLFDLGKEFNSTLKSDEIIKLLGYSLMGEFMIGQFIIFLENNGKIELNHCVGIDCEHLIKAGDKFTDFFNELQLVSYPYKIPGGKLKEVDRVLGEFNFSAVIPMKIHDSTRGILALGRKLTGKPYSKDNFQFLYTLGTLAIISLENARLFEEMLEKQRMVEELLLAREIQQRLLIKDFPVLEKFDIFAINIPSKQVGGDYYDVIKIDEENYCLAIADVSGKGVPAALLMSNLQATLRALVKNIREVDELVCLINNLIYENTDSDKFITFFTGILNVNSGDFNYVNAGHNAPIFVKDGGPVSFFTEGGLILGMMRDVKYAKGRTVIGPGDRLVMYTDGVTEALSAEDEEFGVGRLQKMVERGGHLSVRSLVYEIKNSVKSFAGESFINDDITILAIDGKK
ncbi:MAG: SpoIIE family protein phosphatase [Fidelibacterota bacterium]